MAKDKLNLLEWQKYDEVFENEGRSGRVYDRKFTPNPKFLQGRTNFSTREGMSRPCLSLIEAATSWDWDGPWKVDEGMIGSGKFGWTYSDSWDGKWRPRSSWHSKVRRRRWIRHLLPAYSSPPKQQESDDRLWNDADRINHVIQESSTRCPSIETLNDQLHFDFELARLCSKLGPEVLSVGP